MSEYNLVGVNGNAFSVMGYVSSAMRKEKCTKEEIDEYRKAAMAGDYNNLLSLSVDILDKLNNNNH